MSDPVRWREGGPEHVRAVLRHGRPTRGMTASERTRTAARALAASIVPASVLMLFPAKGLAIGAAIGLAAVVTVTQVVQHSRMPTPKPTSSVPAGPRRAAPSAPIEAAPAEPVIVPAPAVAPPVEPMPAVEPAPPIVRGTQPRVSPTEATERENDALEREAALLERARASLATAPGRALALAEEHAASFPTGKLGIESELVAVDALRLLGRHHEARARGRALLGRASGNIYEDRIRRLLEKLPRL